MDVLEKIIKSTKYLVLYPFFCASDVLDKTSITFWFYCDTQLDIKSMNLFESFKILLDNNTYILKNTQVTNIDIVDGGLFPVQAVTFKGYQIKL